MASLAQSTVERVGNKLSAIEKKKEAVQRQMDVQVQAYALVPKGIESNETIIYYRRERERVAAKQETEVSALEAKIKAMEAKKQAAIDKFDADIEALEAKKKALDEKLTAESDRYSSEIERFRAKLDDPEPPTPAFRKLKADLAMCIEEEVVAQAEFSKACAEMAEANDRRMKAMIREQEEKYARMKQEEFLREQEERERIEARMDREAEEQKKQFEESLKRVGGMRKEVVQEGPIDHVQVTLDAIKNALPPRIPKMYKKPKRVLEMSELTSGSTFTVAELDTIVIDYDLYSEQEIELWEKLRHDACCREGVEGHWVEDV
jgi:hypothetical protein